MTQTGPNSYSGTPSWETLSAGGGLYKHRIGLGENYPSDYIDVYSTDSEAATTIDEAGALINSGFCPDVIDLNVGTLDKLGITQIGKIAPNGFYIRVWSYTLGGASATYTDTQKASLQFFSDTVTSL